MNRYDVISRVGEGAHGIVLKARNIQVGRTFKIRMATLSIVMFLFWTYQSGSEVALKKILLKKLEDGVTMQMFREIKALQELDHRNVTLMNECQSILFTIG